MKLWEILARPAVSSGETRDFARFARGGEALVAGLSAGASSGAGVAEGVRFIAGAQGWPLIGQELHRQIRERDTCTTWIRQGIR